MKTCKRCDIAKDLTAFAPRKANKAGVSGVCKQCKNQRVSETRDALKSKENNLRLRFGLTLAEYNEMFKAQNGCCAICKNTQQGMNKSLAVDHCHNTNIIRGLLCDNCNRALGQFKDSPENLKIAYEYITQDYRTSKIIPITANPGAYRKRGT